MKKAFLLIFCLLLGWAVSISAEERNSKVKKEPSSKQTTQGSKTPYQSSAKEKTVRSSEKIPADAAVSFPQDI